MKIIYFLTVAFIYESALAQDESVFRVSMPKHIQLKPANSVLEPSKTYQFQVNGVAAERIVKFYFSGGTADFKNGELVLKTIDSGDAKKKYSLRAVIKVRENLKEVIVKNFFINKVYKFVEDNDRDSIHVIFYWARKPLWARDTALIKGLPNEYFLDVHRKVSPDTRYSLISFKVSVTHDTTARSYQVARSTRFTPDMIKALIDILPGSLITFQDITYSPVNESADIRMAGPFSIFVRK
jgi:hypothetical protein